MSYGFDEATGLGLKMATFQITGAELLKGLEISLSQLEVTDDFSLQVSGMTFKYNPRSPVGHRVIIGSIRINGKPFVPVAHYTVTVNTGLLSLLTTFGVQVENIALLPDFEYHVVRDYIAQLGSVSYQAEGRIQDISVHAGPYQLVAVSDPMEEVTQSYALHESFPNPFNPSTTISFNVPEQTYLTLKIYNMLGQEVATLVAGNVDAGRHEVIWNAAEPPAGVYFSRLEAGSFKQMKKIMLLK